MSRVTVDWMKDGLEDKLRELAEKCLRKKAATDTKLCKDELTPITTELNKIRSPDNGVDITWESAKQKWNRMCDKAKQPNKRRRFDSDSDEEVAVDGYQSGETGLLGYSGSDDKTPKRTGYPCKDCKQPKAHWNSKCAHCGPVPLNRQLYSSSQRVAGPDVPTESSSLVPLPAASPRVPPMAADQPSPAAAAAQGQPESDASDMSQVDGLGKLVNSFGKEQQAAALKLCIEKGVQSVMTLKRLVELDPGFFNEMISTLNLKEYPARVLKIELQNF